MFCFVVCYLSVCVEAHLCGVKACRVLFFFRGGGGVERKGHGVRYLHT